MGHCGLNISMNLGLVMKIGGKTFCSSITFSTIKGITVSNGDGKLYEF